MTPSFPVRYSQLGPRALVLIHSRCGCGEHRLPLRQSNLKPAGLQRVLAAAAVGIRCGPQAADIYVGIALRLFDHLLRSTVLFFDVCLDDLRGQTRSQPAVLAALEQHTNHDVGVAPRSESDEPAVLGEIVAVFEPSAGCERYDLGRTRLSGDVDARNM